MTKNVLIVGGVAGGASCAARLRRLDESILISIFDRGPYVSFANCGLPYFVGNVIQDERKLLVANGDLFRKRFDIDVHTNHEVIAIAAQERTITVRDRTTGTESIRPYDSLVLAPGASAIRPALPGIDLPGIFSVRTIPDSRKVREWIASRNAQRAVIVGGGFIGLEMAENLLHRGLQVTIVEKAPHLMPPIDAEMAVPVQERLRERGAQLRLACGITAFRQDGNQLVASTDCGDELTCDLVILAIGVRPETALAKSAGLTLGPHGGIAVDAQQRTSDPHIFAVGDVVESVSLIHGAPVLMPLAGPANRQGRLAADVIAGRASHFRGVQGTSVCGVCGLVIATTGLSAAALERAGITDVQAIYLHPGHHASYYPGARPIHLKVLFRSSDGRLLGAQAVGEEGTEKRIDVIAMAMQLGGTVDDLAEAELCYAPQFGAAKDPINIAGFIASNIRNGDLPVSTTAELSDPNITILDVRNPPEIAAGGIAGAITIPLDELRTRWQELPTDRPLHVLCAAGQRAYYAVRFLRQHHIDARHIPGGYQTWCHQQACIKG